MPRILLVEDNEMNRDMLSRRLRRRGFEVEHADDGYQGLSAARSGSFDLILMDLSLPGLDGWTVARLLKEDSTTRATPIIALTAHAMAGDRDRAMQAGCDDYDTKPVEFLRLLAKIDALLATSDRPTSPANDLSFPPIEEHGKWSILRHDMVGPVFRILGYCELLQEDAFASGLPIRGWKLKAIRDIGNGITRNIDDALIRTHDLDRPVDLEALIPGVVTPARAIICACEEIKKISIDAPDRMSLLEDLDQIRQDASLLISMCWQAQPDSAESSN